MVGCVDDSGQYTGSQIAFLYPDYSTALFGTFYNGEMIKARPARISRIVIKDGVMCPTFDVVSSDRLVSLDKWVRHDKQQPEKQIKGIITSSL